MYSYSSYSFAYGYAIVVAVLATLTALAGTVLSFIFLLPEKKRDRLPGFLRIVADIFNFKWLLTEYIMRALYIFTTLYCIVYGFFTIFTNPGLGFGLLIGGVISTRVVFELIMMLILLVKNTMQIN